MARKTQQTFILHLHPQEYKIFQELIEDRGGGGGQGEGMGREKRRERGTIWRSNLAQLQNRPKSLSTPAAARGKY